MGTGAQWLGWMPQQQLGGMGAGLKSFADALVEIQQQKLFQQDLANMKAGGFNPNQPGTIDPNGIIESRDMGAGPAMPQSRQMQQMLGQASLQNMMLAQQPMTPYQQAQIKATKQSYSGWHIAKEGDGTGLDPGTVYEIGPRGNKQILQRPKPEEPWEDRYKYWQGVKRIAEGSDTGSQTNRLLAQVTGQPYENPKDVETIQLAEEEMRKLREERKGDKAPPKMPPQKQSSSRVPQLQGPPPSKVAGEKTVNSNIDTRIRQEVLFDLPREDVVRVYREAGKLRDIWGDLTDEEKVSAYKKLAEGWTGEELIRGFRAQ